MMVTEPGIEGPEERAAGVAVATMAPVGTLAYPVPTLASPDRDRTSRLLRGLDSAQRRTVTHGDGPLLVVAGAGTGKTRVITRRIAWLIATRRARPSEILALTFTDRAANEMQARVDELVPYGYADTAIHTFHAFGDRLVREFAFELGLPSDPRVLTRAESIIFLREHLFELGLRRYLPLGDPTRFLDALAAHASRMRDEDVDAATCVEHAKETLAEARRELERLESASAAPDAAAGPETSAVDAARAAVEAAEGQLEIASASARYRDLLSAAGFLDFADQVHLAVRLLREHPAARERVRRRYRYVLVDEFQDTNRAQLELLALLSGRGGNLMVVGDDDQAIYSFRGAEVRNVIEFRERFGGRVVVLRRNHRSRSPILDAARRLILHNGADRLEVREGLDKRLVAVRHAVDPAPVRHLRFATSSDEADWIAGEITSRIARGRPASGIGVLVRTNADADPILRALSVRGVGWRFSGASGLYARPAVRLLQSFLRAVADPDATVDVYALATAEPYRLGGEDLSRIVETARRTNRSLWTVLGEVAEGRPPHLSPETRRGAQRLVDDLRSSMDLAHERPAGEVLYEFLRRTGTLATLAAGGPGVEESLLDIARFFEIIRRESSLLQDPRVPFVARHLRTLVEAGDDPSAPDVDEPAAGVVSVLTVHKAKGLEFRSVFVAGMADGRFPLRGRPEALPFLPNLAAGDRVRIDELAEERRLCYVAMTRARDELILTSAADTGGRRLRRASPFIAEALDELGVSQPAGTDPLARLERAGNPAPDPVTLVPGGIPGGALSFTQLEDYIACPARYRYRHVLRLPVPPHHAISYGVALHEALAAFGRSQIQGRPLSEEGLLEGFARAWSGEGFLSREHEEARLAAGRQALVRCRERLLAAPGWPVAVEEPFAMVLDGIRVQGRFDRIDETPDGIVITDFKSSDVRDPVRARERARDSLQLALYALAWQAREGSLPHAVQLSFVDSGVIGRVTPDRGRMARAAGKVRSVADGVLVGSFSATPGAVTCGFCPFHEICPSSAV